MHPVTFLSSPSSRALPHQDSSFCRRRAAASNAAANAATASVGAAATRVPVAAAAAAPAVASAAPNAATAAAAARPHVVLSIAPMGSSRSIAPMDYYEVGLEVNQIAHFSASAIVASLSWPFAMVKHFAAAATAATIFVAGLIPGNASVASDSEDVWPELINSWYVEEELSSVGVDTAGTEEIRERVAPFGSYSEGNMLRFFIRNMSIAESGTVALPADALTWPGFEDGLRHFRLVQGHFPDEMMYHFDGLATILRFDVNATHVNWNWKPFQSEAAEDYESCIFFGTGTGPTLPGRRICFQNPGVNLLPVANQLWLTIDTLAWGRIDPITLETLPNARVNVDSMVLNAHPACDRATGECFVQHPCGRNPYTDQACVSKLVPKNDSNSQGRFQYNLGTELLSNATMPKKRLIQHSHSLCVTDSFVVAKLDNFQPRSPKDPRHGLLRYTHQRSATEFIIMNRDTLESTVIAYDEHSEGDNQEVRNDLGFVNNHFWNCYEDPTSDGADVIVETVAASDSYLDQYFSYNLEAKTEWAAILQPSLRCRIPARAALNKTSSSITCSSLGPSLPYFDYPTFNPKWKTRADYQYFYAIAALSTDSRWFDSLVKIGAKAGPDGSAAIVAQWSSPHIYLTEADFIPGWNADGSEAPEDHGTLLSVAYNATSDLSSLAIFNASDLNLLSMLPLQGVIPFHAHGIICPNGSDPSDDGKGCFSNP